MTSRLRSASGSVGHIPQTRNPCISLGIIDSIESSVQEPQKGSTMLDGGNFPVGERPFLCTAVVDGRSRSSNEGILSLLQMS